MTMKAPSDPLVAGVASNGQVAIALGERRAVLCLYGIANRLDRTGCIGHERHRNSPIEVGRLLEACPDLIGFVGRELPVPELSGEPELDMPQLDLTHDVAKRGPVEFLLGDGERCQDEADEKSTDQGKVFHFRTPFHQSLLRPTRRDLSLARMRGPSIDPGSSSSCPPIG